MVEDAVFVVYVFVCRFSLCDLCECGRSALFCGRHNYCKSEFLYFGIFSSEPLFDDGVSSGLALTFGH